MSNMTVTDLRAFIAAAEDFRDVRAYESLRRTKASALVVAYQRLACIERNTAVEQMVGTFASLPKLEGEAAEYVERAAQILALKAADAICEWIWPSVVDASFDDEAPAVAS